MPRSRPSEAPPSGSAPDITLVLGAGGARGLSHIAVLEAFDELGLKPARISGCSIGAIIGAAYAAGVSGRELREHVLATFRDRARVIARLLDCRVGKLADLVRGLGNPVLIDGERLLDLFWPETVPDRFEELAIPFTAVAADYHRHSEVVLHDGPLTPAVAASLACRCFEMDWVRRRKDSRAVILTEEGRATLEAALPGFRCDAPEPVSPAFREPVPTLA